MNRIEDCFGLPSMTAALVTLVLAFHAPPASAAVELVTNGGFETGDLTDWTCTDADFCDDTLLAHSGGFAFEGYDTSGAPGVLSQTIPTVPGTQYDFSFFSQILSSDPADPANALRYSLDGGAPVLVVGSPAAYAQTTDSFTAGGASAVISFLFQTDSIADIWFIDDVSVTEPMTVIPLPATMPLAAGALALLGLLGLRRRRPAAG